MSLLSLSLEISANAKGIQTVKVEQTQRPGLHWTLKGDQTCYSDLERWMTAFGMGKQPSVSLCLDISSMPPFTQLVLREMQEIPFGQTTSYGTLAELLGCPKGARAVGNACGRNPMPVLIPCHRVLAANGKLGGFSIGPNLKQHLLQFEGITAHS